MNFIIGLLMRAYRKSPLYPHLGKCLAKVLHFAVTIRGGSGSLVIKEIEGIRYELDLTEVIDSSLYFSGTFERGTEEALEKLLKPGDCAIDIGANVGYLSLRMAKLVGQSGSVYALEPGTSAWNRLQRNIELNNFKTIQTFRAALGDVNIKSADLPIRSNYKLSGVDPVRIESVPLMTLDEFVKTQHLTKIGFIKCDVDGYEGKIFKGARETISSFRPHLYFEINPGVMSDLGDSALEMLSTLEKLGYKFKLDLYSPTISTEQILELGKTQASINLIARPGGDT